MEPSEVVIPASTVFKGTTRHLAVPSCTLTTDDLRKLYELLARKAKEAADHQVAGLQRSTEQTKEQFEQVKEDIRSALALVVQVQGNTGEWTGGSTDGVLSDESLPDSILSVQYDSGFLFRTRFNLHPENSVSLYLDFTRTSVLDTSTQPALNKSTGVISGANSTWANGTYEELTRFFSERVNGRGWLHTPHAYDIALLVFGFPASFALIYRIDHLLRQALHVSDALFVALYVYLVLIALFAFRVLFNYTKWVLPKCEGPTRRQGGPKSHKAVLVTVGVSVISVVIETLLRMIGLPLP